MAKEDLQKCLHDCERDHKNKNSDEYLKCINGCKKFYGNPGIPLSVIRESQHRTASKKGGSKKTRRSRNRRTRTRRSTR